MNRLISTGKYNVKRLVILNPASRNGEAAKIFRTVASDLRHSLGHMEIYVTRCPGDATGAVRHFLKRKSYDQILIAGGDGTVNEAVNGYFEGGRLLSRTIPLGIINLSTGGDFYRTLVQTHAMYDLALKNNHFRLIDCCRLVFSSGKTPHYFINESSAGVAGKIVHSLKQSSFQWGPPAYLFHTVKSLLPYRAPRVRLFIEDHTGEKVELETEIINFFACNGQFLGGGMHWAPEARLEDGLFDLVVVSRISKLVLIRNTPLVYAGRISEFPGTVQLRARSVRLVPIDPLAGEADGEVISISDGEEIHYEILPRKFPVIM